MIIEIVVACMVTSFLTAGVMLLSSETLSMRSDMNDIIERSEENEENTTVLEEKVRKLEEFVSESLKPPEYKK